MLYAFQITGNVFLTDSTKCNTAFKLGPLFVTTKTAHVGNEKMIDCAPLISRHRFDLCTMRKMLMIIPKGYSTGEFRLALLFEIVSKKS